VLLGLLLGAIAWLAITPDAPREQSSKPAATIALPPPPETQATAPEESAAAPDEAAAPAPAQSEPEPQPQPEPPQPEQHSPAQPPSLPEPPPVAEAPAEPEPAPAPAPAPEAPVRPEPSTPEAQAPAKAPEAAPQDKPAVAPQAAIPAPPAYQPQEHRTPAPAPDGLAPAPDPNLVEETRDGPLPVVGKNGRKPWQVYARPFDLSDKRPRVALIISGLGQSSSATEAAIQRLPGAVTLAFSPYAKNLDQWVTLARADGHEVLLTVPMEPLSYPENDPGPHTLLTSLSDQENEERLRFLLSRFPGYVGVLNTMGARMTTTPHSLKPILMKLKERGLLFVDARSSLRSVAASEATEIGLPRAINNRFIDIKASRSDIDQRLDELVRIAREGGYALGIGSPYPVTIERVALWVQELDGQGIALAPVSALVDKQPD
jgi:polysaccharide deacetylase 2 family uncharacterized protein YibQ